MRTSLALALIVPLLALTGCSTSPVEQVRALQASTRCCTEAAALPAVPLALGEPRDGVMDGDTALVRQGAARAPARAYRLPPGAAGAVVDVTAYPDMGAVTAARSLVFAPLSMAFLDEAGRPIDGLEQTEPLPASGGSLYLFVVTRQARIPANAATLLLVSDPAAYGTQRELKQRTPSYLMPVAGVFVPMGGGDTVTAIWSPYGKYRLVLRR